MESDTADSAPSAPPSQEKRVSLRKLLYSSAGFGVFGVFILFVLQWHWFSSALLLPAMLSVFAFRLLSGLPLWKQVAGSIVASLLFGWPIAFLIGGINVITYGSPQSALWFLWLLLFALPPLFVLELFKARQKVLCRGLAIILAVSLYPLSAALIFDFSRAEFTPGNDELDAKGRTACLGPRVKKCGFLVSNYFDNYDGSEWVWQFYSPFVDRWFSQFDGQYYRRSYPNGVPRRIH